MQITTEKGEVFSVCAHVKVGEQWMDVDSLDPEMRQRLATCLNERGLNAAYHGERVYK